MDKKEPAKISEEEKNIFYSIIQSPQHMQDWIKVYLDIYLPCGHVDPDSNSSPIEAMYDAYASYRDDKSLSEGGFIWLASRDSGKTLCGSILNTLLMVHFKAQIAHLAAVKKQAEKNIEYTNTWVRKITPYLEVAGRKVISDSKSKIQILNEDNTVSFVDIIVANLAGGNSQHTPVATFDELDTLSKQGIVGYKESLMIPTRLNGKGPLTIKFSTRKFAAGVFEREIQNIHNTGEQLKRWNIIDITERCPPSRHLPDLPTEIRFIAEDLPLRNISKNDFENLSDKEKEKFHPIEAYSGCVKCPLLPVCKKRLSMRDSSADASPALKSLYRSIDFTIGQFKKIDHDMAEAQLMCRKPSSYGLLYPKFSETENKISISDAMKVLTGETPPANVSPYDVFDQIKKMDIPVYVGGDWGHSGGQAFVVAAVIPNGDFWVLETFQAGDLEFDEVLHEGLAIKERYNPKHWYMDNNNPQARKAFSKNGMKCYDFQSKDIQAGIDAVRKVVCSATGKRTLKILEWEKNKMSFEMFRKHSFKLDAAGEPTRHPDDGPESHVGDSFRYLGQNLFAPKNKGKFFTTGQDEVQRPVGAYDPKPLQGVVNSLTGGGTAMSNNSSSQSPTPGKKSKKFWA